MCIAHLRVCVCITFIKLKLTAQLHMNWFLLLNKNGDELYILC